MKSTDLVQLLRELADFLLGPVTERADSEEIIIRADDLASRARQAAEEIEGRRVPSRDDLMQILFDSFRGPIEFVCDTQEEGELMAKSHVKFALAMLAHFGGGEGE